MTTKITHVEEKTDTYQGKPKKSYIFTLSDGLIGYAANKAPWEFKVGDDITYAKEVRKSSKGEYNLFTFTRVVPQVPLPQTGGVGSPPINLPEKTPLSPQGKIAHKVEAAIKSMEFVMDVFGKERIEWDVVIAKQKECVRTLWSEIDEIYQSEG